MTHFCDCTKLRCESQKQKPEATSQTAQDEDRQALLQRGKTEIKEERKKKKKRILTALDQASRKRFTFEYGRCSSKRTEFARKRRKQDREERKAPLHSTEKRRERAIRMQTSPISHYNHNKWVVLE